MPHAPHRCNAPEINCISLVGVVRDGEPGFAVLVGGGLSSVPRLARDLGVWIRQDEALPVLRALLDAWKEDLRYRLSRVKARLKFMVDDCGPEGMREEVERRLGYALPDFTLPPPEGEPATTWASSRNTRRVSCSVGAPVHLGLVSGDQMIAVADLAGSSAATSGSRGSRTSCSRACRRPASNAASAELGAIGFPVDVNPHPRQLDRMHRRAALQLRRHRDEDPARRA